MNNQPLVSIGIPTFNRPDGLRRTLECITTQTYRNLEIIVSDNSTPNNAIDSIVEQFIKHDTRIRYFKQIENKGPVFNWNYVLKQATGEFFMWAADDDRWIPNYINCCVHEFLRQGDDLVSVKMETCFYSMNGEFSFFPEGKFFYNITLTKDEERLFYMLEHVFDNLIYSVFRKKALFLGVQTFFEIVDFGFPKESPNEIPLLLLASISGNFQVIPEVGFYKKTTESTYLQARWEIEGGMLPNSDYSGYEQTLPINYDYHQNVLEYIKKSLTQLPISPETQEKTRRKAEETIWRHYSYFVNRYKEAQK